MSGVPDDQPGIAGSVMSADNRCGGCQWIGIAFCRGEADPRCCMGPKPPALPRCPTCGQVSR